MRVSRPFASIDLIPVIVLIVIGAFFFLADGPKRGERRGKLTIVTCGETVDTAIGRVFGSPWSYDRTDGTHVMTNQRCRFEDIR